MVNSGNGLIEIIKEFSVDLPSSYSIAISTVF